MRTFKDPEGNVWEVQFTLPNFRRIREKTKLTLHTEFDPDFLDKILHDLLLLFDVAECLIESQLKERGIPIPEFESMFHGADVEDVALAICRAYIDWQPEAARERLHKVFDGIFGRRVEKRKKVLSEIKQAASEVSTKQPEPEDQVTMTG